MSSSIVKSHFILILVGMMSGCMMRLENVWYSDPRIWTMPQEEKKILDQNILKYLTAHEELPDDIKDALIHKKAIRGMNKDQVSLLLGPPEKIVLKGATEIWWYEVRETHCLFYLFPLGWPWLLIHPMDLFDCKEREELYWREGLLLDVKSYHVEVL